MPYNIKVTAENNENINAKIDVITPLLIQTREELDETTNVLNGIIGGTVTEISNSKITKVRDYAFEYYSLKSVDLPNTTSIGNNAFSGCTSLTSVNFLNATSIGDFAFSGCTSLTSVYLPNLIYNGDRSFQNCTSLTSIDLPNITNVWTRLFYNCNSLTSIYLAKAKIIGNDAFFRCYALANIYLGYNGIVSLSNTSAFNGIQINIVLHVRSEYADQYATATNWSSLIASGKITVVGDYSD